METTISWGLYTTFFAASFKLVTLCFSWYIVAETMGRMREKGDGGDGATQNRPKYRRVKKTYPNSMTTVDGGDLDHLYIVSFLESSKP